MKNVTITLDDRTAAWARKQAAAQERSLSRFVGELLERTMRQSREYERAMQQYFAQSPTQIRKRGSQYPGREELHDRDGIR